MAFDVFHQVYKNGKLKSDGAFYVVADDVGIVQTATAMTLVTGFVGVYFASLDPSGWDRSGDAFYTVQTYDTNKPGVKGQENFYTVAVIDGEAFEIANDILVDAIKTKTDQFVFTDANKVDARIDRVGANTVTSPDDFKADVSALALEASIDDVDTAIASLATDLDLLEDGTDGLAAIKAQVDKIDAAAMTAPSSVVTNSLADYLMNKDGSKTYSKTTDSLEALRDRGDAAWTSGGGGGGGDVYGMIVIPNAAGSSKKISIGPTLGGLLETTGNLTLTIKRRIPGSPPVTVGSLSAASPSADDWYDLDLGFTPAAGEVYTVTGTIEFSSVAKAVTSGFMAQ